MSSWDVPVSVGDDPLVGGNSPCSRPPRSRASIVGEMSASVTVPASCVTSSRRPWEGLRMTWYNWGPPYSPLCLLSRLTSCPSYSASISSMARRSSSPAGSSSGVRAGVALASGTKWVLRSEMGSTNPVSSRSVAVGLESEEDTEDDDFALWGTVAGGVLSSSGAQCQLPRAEAFSAIA